jgi:hypothetical protein
MDMVFSTRVQWADEAETPTGSFDFASTLLHELGHVAGLDHSAAAGAVMLPRLGRGQQRRALTDDDIAGLRSLYPAAEPPQPPATPPPDDEPTPQPIPRELLPNRLRIAALAHE